MILAAAAARFGAWPVPEQEEVVAGLAFRAAERRGLALGLHRAVEDAGGQHGAGAEPGGGEAAPAECGEDGDADDPHRVLDAGAAGGDLVDGHLDGLAEARADRAERLLAEGDLVGGGRRAARQQREVAAAAHLVEADRGHDHAVDGELPVVAARVPADRRYRLRHLAGLGAGSAAEVEVHLLHPVLPVVVRRADQADEAGAENGGGRERGDRDDAARQRAADRDRGPAVARLERHRDPGAAGHGPGVGQRRREPRRSRLPGDGLGHAKRALRLAGRPPRGRCEHGEGKQGDGGEPGAEDGEVNLDAGVRFC